MYIYICIYVIAIALL